MSQEEKNKIEEYQRKKYQELVQYKNEALKNKPFFVFSLHKKWVKKTLKFCHIRPNKNEFHYSKEQIDLMSVIVDQIVVSDKFKHNNEGFKYFIGYQEGEIVKPLCIILPQMSGYIKYFESRGQNMSFLMKDDEVWKKYKQVWDVIKNKLGNKSQSGPV